MDVAFGWIGRIFEFLGTFVPRLLIVDATQLGVAFRRGKHIICLVPGLHIFWPFWTTVTVRAAVRQTDNLPTQALQTKDNKTIVVGGMVRYRIIDVRKAVAETFDLDTAIIDESLAVICEYIVERDFTEVRGNRQKSNTAITKKIRTALKTYGVEVERAQLTDLSTCMTLCHLGTPLHGVTEDG